MKAMKRVATMIIVIGLCLSSVSICKNNAMTETEDRTEIQDLRTENSKTYQLSDGSRECVVYAEDIHYVDSNGKLKDIDNSINEDKENKKYKYTNTANSWNVSFADHLTEENAVLIQKDDFSLSFSIVDGHRQSSVQRSQVLSGMKSEYYKEISEDERAVVYQDIFDKVDIVYSVRTGSVKEDIILKEQVENSTFKFAINTKNLLVSQENNEILFRDSLGNEIFSIGKLYMVDANGKYSEEVSTELLNENGVDIVRITASEEYLYAADTCYPVVIDPSTTVTGSTTKDTCVDEQYPSSNYYTSQNLWTGGKTGTNTMRTYIQFNIPSSISSCITRATLRIKKNAYATPGIKAYRVTSSWTSSSVTWNNKPGYTTSGASGTCSNSSGDWYQMDVTGMVYNWKHGTDNYGFLLKEPSESNSDQKTRWYSSDAPSPNKPELVIRYVNLYGSRAYESNSTGINCMAYALDYPSNIGASQLGMGISDTNGMQLYGIYLYVKTKAETWMNNYLTSSKWHSLSSYDADISSGWYRAVFRVGFYDMNNNGVRDSSEPWDMHWQYQTNGGYGLWAEKHGTGMASNIASDSNGYDPGSRIWPCYQYPFNYNSTPGYYTIKGS